MIKAGLIPDEMLTWLPSDGGCGSVVFQVRAEELRGRLQVRSIHQHQATLHNVSTRTTNYILVTNVYWRPLTKTHNLSSNLWK